MICIAQFVTSQLEICLFGNNIRLELVPTDTASAEAADRAASEADAAPSFTEVHVQKKDFDHIFARIEGERQRVDRELRRRHNLEAAAYTHDTLDDPAFVEAGLDEDVHEFQTMAAQ